MTEAEFEMRLAEAFYEVEVGGGTGRNGPKRDESVIDHEALKFLLREMVADIRSAKP